MRNRVTESFPSQLPKSALNTGRRTPCRNKDIQTWQQTVWQITVFFNPTVIDHFPLPDFYNSSELNLQFDLEFS